MKYFLFLFLSICLFACESTDRTTENEIETPIETVRERWSEERAWEWYDNLDWLVGANFNPSISINQLEFWQAETFDLETIERELGWSADLGMNAHRVYLHNLLWDQDSIGFLERLEAYLEVADKYDIKTMFVLLDDVWHPVPKLGKQPEPMPHIHNSGWVQSPGAAILGDTSRHDELENYVKGILRYFANDERVFCWDVYNEPGNASYRPGRKELEVQNKDEYSLALLKKVIGWGRSVETIQPMTAGQWRGTIEHWGTPDSLPPLESYMATASDVTSFHAYDGEMDGIRRKITELKKYGRPILCTEYVARGGGNTFEAVLPILKENNIAAFNWGLVDGKTNTKYPWSSWREPFTEEPEVWHHDIFRADGTPYSEEEVAFLKDILK